MDNERDALDRGITGKPTYEELSQELSLSWDKNYDLQLKIADLEDKLNVDEKQWKIELISFELEKLKLEREIAEYNNSAKACELETIKIKAESLNKACSIKVSCGHCSAEFEYHGYDEELMNEMLDRFVDEHGYCR